MTDRIEVDYQSLTRVASQFAQQASQIQQMQRRIISTANSLQSGWQGHGSEAFFKEMYDLVLPSVERLRQALEEAGRVTTHAGNEIATAEEQASAPFRAR